MIELDLVPRFSSSKIHVVAWDISRNGGVEEVGRQVLQGIQDAGFCASPFLIKKGKLSSRLSTLVLSLKILMGDSIVVMHPFIFERISFTL